LAIVRNLMVRIGADFSDLRKGMDGATSRLNQFARDTRRATNEIRGRKGIGGINTELKNLGRTVTDSLSQVSGAKGLGGITRALGGLKPALGAATTGLRGLGGAAGGASLAIGGLVAVLAVLTAGIYAASQRAVKFEADLGRLNMQLKGGARDFMDWAQSLGFARETAASMGATYATLLSSFIEGQEDLNNATKLLVQTTRVVASATGRSIEDVMERMRSGLLGNTEAIEDLGIFVNVSMIESTKAFRRFAGDKSWEQLDFQMQQQIRLAAILEQAYDRYGDQLQDNVMTKQELLMEQLKDIKLNLSQAFLPIWDAVLPALTELASSLAYVTEQIARFTYWLRGWDYDERTRGLDQYGDVIKDTGDNFDDMADSAAKARSELAAFDRLNLLGFGKVGDGVSGGGSGQFEPPEYGNLLPGERDVRNWSDLFYLWVAKQLRRIKDLRPRIKFDPPDPPDAGVGGVATNVVATVNRLSAQLKARYANTWADLDAQTQVGLTGQLSQFAGFASILAPQWSELWAQLRSIAQVESGTIRTTWQTMLDSMLAKLRSTVPPVQTDWQTINASVRSTQPALSETKLTWDVTLRDMLARLTAHVPQFEVGWWRIGDAIRSILSPLSEVRLSWSEALGDMYATIQQRVSGIVNQVQQAITALRNLQQASGQTPSTSPAPAPAAAPAPANTSKAPATSPTTAPGASIFDDLIWTQRAVSTIGQAQPQQSSQKSFDLTTWQGWVEGWTYGLRPETMQRAGEWLEEEMSKPQNEIPLTLLERLGLGGALKAVGKGAQWLQKTLKKAVPAFASGGVVSGPTLGWVGEYVGAVNNPEVIAPLSDLESMIDNQEQIDILRRILAAIERGQVVTVTISEDEIAQAAVRGHNKIARRTGRSPFII